jgi:tetratricopeptide (TPR) repeat protein
MRQRLTRLGPLLVLLALVSMLGTAPPAWGVGARGVHQRAYRTGQPGILVDDLRKKLAEDPDHLDNNALLANSLTRMGLFSEARELFKSSRGSSYYEEDGLAAEADTLRAFGHPMEALQLRLQRRIMIQNEYAESLLLLKAADDARAARDFALAEDLIDESMGIHPNSAEAWGALVDLYVDLGRLDDAEFALWRGRQIPSTSLRIPLAEARLNLVMGEPLAALLVLQRVYQSNRYQYDMSVLRMIAKWKLGDRDDALSIARQKRFVNRQYPEMMALRALIAAEAGEMDDVRAVLDRAHNLFPEREIFRFVARKVDYRPDATAADLDLE